MRANEKARKARFDVIFQKNGLRRAQNTFTAEVQTAKCKSSEMPVSMWLRLASLFVFVQSGFSQADLQALKRSELFTDLSCANLDDLIFTGSAFRKPPWVVAATRGPCYDCVYESLALNLLGTALRGEFLKFSVHHVVKSHSR